MSHIVVETDEFPVYDQSTGQVAGTTTRVITLFDTEASKLVEVPWPKAKKDKSDQSET